MKVHKSNTSGFTLVELAIVMTIIGLLIGGVLKGQELVTNARISATMAQVKAYETAVTAFRDIYNAMPGDLGRAGDRIPGCTQACSNNVAVGTMGGWSDDGYIGVTYYASQGWIPHVNQLNVGTAQSSIDAETTLFWIHLLKANLVSGLSDQALHTPTPPEFGVTQPMSKFGGGFVVGYADGLRSLVNNPSTVHITGHILGLTSGFHMAYYPHGQSVMPPARAQQLDRKMDDGMPDSGSVQAFGTTPTGGEPSCIETTTPFNYAENNSANDCGLAFKIQN